MRKTLINIILFQVGWFACVISAANNQPWLGALIACLIIAFNISVAIEKEKEALLILFAMVLGAIWDSFLVWQNWVTYPSGIISTHIAPYWIILMWGLFAATLNVSLRWLRDRLFVASIFGAIAGPLAYYAGFKLNAVQFTDVKIALIYLSIGWALFTPLLIYFATFFDGYADNKSRGAS